MGDERLDRAREELQRASEHAGAHVQTQLESLEGGIFEEESGTITSEEPGPKVDRVVEVVTTLDGLESKADREDVRDRIGTAHDLLQTYLRDHPDDA